MWLLTAKVWVSLVIFAVVGANTNFGTFLEVLAANMKVDDDPKSYDVDRLVRFYCRNR